MISPIELIASVKKVGFYYLIHFLSKSYIADYKGEMVKIFIMFIVARFQGGAYRQIKHTIS